MTPSKDTGKKIVTFYTGYTSSFNPKDPDNNLEACYGSELSTKNLAEYLTEYYDVHVFSSGNNKKSTYKGVTYHNYNKYNRFQQRYNIYVLIISRYINFFLQSIPLADKIFFWSHDTTVQPYYNFKKLPGDGVYLTLNVLPYIDKYIVLTETHKNFVLDWLENDRYLGDHEKEKFTVIGNGLEPSYFIDGEERVELIKNRFIYCSNPNRGLDLLLDIIPKLHSLDKSVTLDIFYSSLSDELTEKIKKLPFVRVRGKVSQAELAVEMKKSEFLLYPCTFFETYCMVALECQMAGVIPICTKRGGLIDTISNRGVLIDWDDNREKFIQDCVTETYKIMNDEPLKDQLRELGIKHATYQSYKNITSIWRSLIEACNEEKNNTFESYEESDDSN